MEIDALSEKNKSLEENVIRRVREELSTKSPGIPDSDVMRIIEDAVLDMGREAGLGFREKKVLAELVFNVTRKELGILDPFSEDDDVCEIMVNGPDRIFIEKNGQMKRLPVRFENRQELEELIRRIAARVNREINDINPIVDARLDDGSRVNAIYSNVAVDGPVLTIRKFPKKVMKMNDLIRMGTITEEAADYLRVLVETGHNIFVSGGTSSGKTTFLNILSEYIPVEERVVVIEDSAELQLEGIENLVRLETRNANSQGKGAVNIRQLIKSSLRMRPDRIVVGEVRGGEALDMLQALNSGHDGCMSTGHSNSAEGMMYRLETMVLTAENFPLDAIRKQIISALDIVVHLGRFSDMKRRVLEISEVNGGDRGEIVMNKLFVFDGSTLKKTGNKLKNKSKISMRFRGDKSEFI